MIALRYALLSLAVSALLVSCDWPGKPNKDTAWQPPSSITNPNVLYSQNCAGCHGDDTHSGASVPMNNPTYLALIPQATMRGIISNGISGTSMPAFGQAHGGPLTDQQIDILVSGIYSKKTAGNTPPGPLPPYNAPPGNVAAGAQAFSVYCASCHGADGNGGPKAGSIIDPAYLTLVSTQYLRTVIIAGRPDIGMPDWRTDANGKTMSDQDISDVVAWLASHRPVPGASPSPQPAIPATTP